MNHIAKRISECTTIETPTLETVDLLLTGVMGRFLQGE
jgi:hypothetical protein